LPAARESEARAFWSESGEILEQWLLRKASHSGAMTAVFWRSTGLPAQLRKSCRQAMAIFVLACFDIGPYQASNQAA
jgi:hypothetical protein